jgi:GNAT superfamily N-acetyltransferase
MPLKAENIENLQKESNTMSDTDLQMTENPVEAEWNFIEEQISLFNINTTGYDDYRPIAIFVRDDAGAIIAGLTAFTWGGTLRIQFVWVHENLRKHGYGKRLVAAAEQEAIARGCKQAVLDTHSFQSPEFYPKLGYSVCGVMDDYPVGYQQLVFQKRLI